VRFFLAVFRVIPETINNLNLAKKWLVDDIKSWIDRPAKKRDHVIFANKKVRQI